MDKDINKMFQEKNKEILTNSLILEMERNLESLKNTTDNCVSLETNKLLQFLTSYFDEQQIEYKKEELQGFLYREKEKINKIVNSIIEEKKNRIKENYLQKEITTEVIDEQFIKDYYDELEKETGLINDDIDIEVKKEISMSFFQELLKKYRVSTIEEQERLNSRVNILYCQTIIKRIKEQAEFRDESLKNMAKESYERYLNLNKSTTG